MVECTECGATLSVDTSKTEVGEILSCHECGVELEVTSSEPFSVAPAPEEKEDWGE